MPDSSSVMELTESWDGMKSIRHNRRPKGWNDAKARLIELVENHKNLPEHVRVFRLQEAMSTEDFPLLFGDTLDVQMLAAYREVPSEVRRLFRISPNIPDFRAVKRNRLTGVRARLERVEQTGEYSRRRPSESQSTYSLSKWGAKIEEFSWETIINDDLGVLNQLPNDLGISARRTEDYFLTTLLFNANGPLDSIFAASGGAGSVAATALNATNLEAGFQAMAQYTDSAGEPLYNRPMFLVVPPALEHTALSLVGDEKLAFIVTGTTSSRVVERASTLNAMRRYNIQVIVDPWIPIVVTAGTIANTTWLLISDPSMIPIGEFGLLRGHNSPELFMRSSGQVKVGGGTSSPFDGSFENDTVEYKVRHVLGGTTLDPRAGWASDGQ